MDAVTAEGHTALYITMILYTSYRNKIREKQVEKTPSDGSAYQRVKNAKIKTLQDHWCAITERAKLLIRIGCSVSISLLRGLSVVQHNAYGPDTQLFHDIVRLLIERGQENAMHGAGSSAYSILELVAKNKHTIVLQILVARTAHITYYRYACRYVMHLAAESSHVQAIPFSWHEDAILKLSMDPTEALFLSHSSQISLSSGVY